MNRTRMVEAVGFVAAIAGIITAVDYYFIQSGLARITLSAPVWSVVLVVVPMSLAVAIVARRLRNDALVRPERLLPSDAGSVMKFVESRGLLAEAERLDICSYTAETILGPWRDALEKHPRPLRVRLLVRRPETDPEKREVAEGSLKTAREIVRLNSNIDLDIHFYSSDPLLRLQFYTTRNRTTCLAGIYRHVKDHPMHFVGSEQNRMFVLDGLKPDETEVISCLKSRFDLMWERTSSLRAALFDLDGVLVDSMENHHRAWRSGFTHACIPFDDNIFRQDIYRLEGCGENDLAEELCLKYAKGQSGPETIQRILERKRAVYSDETNRIKPFPGTSDLLWSLRERQVPMALVSGAARPVVDRILARCFPNLFDAVVTGDDVSAGKPDPQPFVKALEKLRLRDTWSCVAIENAPLGVRAASAAGVLVLGILRNSPLEAGDLSDAGASRVFASVDDLRKVLESASFGRPL